MVGATVAERPRKAALASICQDDVSRWENLILTYVLIFLNWLQSLQESSIPLRGSCRGLNPTPRQRSTRSAVCGRGLARQSRFVLVSAGTNRTWSALLNLATDEL